MVVFNSKTKNEHSNKTRPLISLTTDFGDSNQGIGIMKGVAHEISPNASVIDLTHEILEFSAIDGARQFETVYWLPIGIHVCVIDFGVGTERKAIIIKTKRGDYLVGPDNGIMIPSAKKLGGIIKVVSIENEKYMRHPISSTFHGRDIFMPAAAWLSIGVSMDEFGHEIAISDLCVAPFHDAIVKDFGFTGMVIHIHPKFGTLSTNIRANQITNRHIEKGDLLKLEFENSTLTLPFVNTFGDVPTGKELIFLDDYDRTSIAINMGNFAQKYMIKVGDSFSLKILRREKN